MFLIDLTTVALRAMGVPAWIIDDWISGIIDLVHGFSSVIDLICAGSEGLP